MAAAEAQGEVTAPPSLRAPASPAQTPSWPPVPSLPSAPCTPCCFPFVAFILCLHLPSSFFLSLGCLQLPLTGLSLFPTLALCNAPIPPSPLASPSLLSFLLQQQEDSLEKVIKDTESLFKTREKEYQETIDQIEVRLGCLKLRPGIGGTPDTFSCGGGALRPRSARQADLGSSLSPVTCNCSWAACTL